MRVAITGAGGLLGGALVEHAFASGHDVLALSGSLDHKINVEVVRWDARQDFSRTAKVLHNVDVVVHAGAHIPADHYDAEEARQCIEVNALGTLNLIRACETSNVRRFIYVSGANVLKPRSEYVCENDSVGCEYSPYYLGSKLLGEVYVRAKVARGMNGLIVRPSSIYGPGMKSGALWSFAQRLKHGLPINLLNGGKFKADYVWRDDVVNVLGEAIVGQQKGEVNVGSGMAWSIVEISKLLISIFDADPGLIKCADVKSSEGGAGFAPVDITLARSWFNFNPMQLEEGLCHWFRKVKS